MMTGLSEALDDDDDDDDDGGADSYDDRADRGSPGMQRLQKIGILSGCCKHLRCCKQFS